MAVDRKKCRKGAEAETGRWLGGYNFQGRDGGLDQDGSSGVERSGGIQDVFWK